MGGPLRPCVYLAQLWRYGASKYMYRDTHTQTDRKTSLLISSNVHYVHLGGDNYYFHFSTCAIYILLGICYGYSHGICHILCSTACCRTWMHAHIAKIQHMKKQNSKTSHKIIIYCGPIKKWHFTSVHIFTNY